MPGRLLERESETGLAGEAGFEVIDALAVAGVLRLHASRTADFYIAPAARPAKSLRITFILPR